MINLRSIDCRLRLRADAACLTQNEVCGGTFSPKDRNSPLEALSTMMYSDGTKLLEVRASSVSAANMIGMRLCQSKASVPKGARSSGLAKPRDNEIGAQQVEFTPENAGGAHPSTRTKQEHGMVAHTLRAFGAVDGRGSGRPPPPAPLGRGGGQMAKRLPPRRLSG